jgi:hypothetical protein
MGYNGGAARSCSSFADLVKKNIQRFKAKLALNRWIFFWVGSAKLEQLRAAPPL